MAYANRIAFQCIYSILQIASYLFKCLNLRLSETAWNIINFVKLQNLL
jgi:hypothetical protein